MKSKRMNLRSILSFAIITLALFSCEEALNDLENKGIGKTTISDNITENVTWEAGKTYIIDGTIRVGETETVVITVEPGAIIKFNEDAALEFAYWDDTYATIKALGTESDPIIFEQNGSSNWGRMSFYKGAINCEFSYCEFNNGGSNDYYGNLHLEETKVSFSNCSIKNSASNGFTLREAAAFNQFSSNSFSGISGNPISIYPEAIHSIGENNSYESGQKINVEGEDFTKAGEYTWKKQDAPYRFEGSFRIGSEKTEGLNISVEPGTVFEFAIDVYIDFAYWDDTYTTFIAIGTEEDPILFTSASPSKEAGDWRSLNFYDGAIDCEFDFCEFSYGGGGSYGMIYLEETTLSITNSSIAFSGNHGIDVREEAEFFTFHRNTFHDNALHPISIYPNAVYSMGPENLFEEGTSIHVSNDEHLTMSGEFTWLNQSIPYQIEGLMRIGSPKGSNLNINKGTVLKFENDASIQVAYWDDDFGKIISKGTSEEPVVFTTNNPSPAKGDWNGISLHKGSDGTKLDYCIIDYAGGLSYSGALNLSETGANTSTISNSTISNSALHGITVDDESSIDYSSVTFINNEGADYKAD